MVRDCIWDDEIDYSDVIDECENDELVDSFDREFEEFMSSIKSLKSWV